MLWQLLSCPVLSGLVRSVVTSVTLARLTAVPTTWSKEQSGKWFSAPPSLLHVCLPIFPHKTCLRPSILFPRPRERNTNLTPHSHHGVRNGLKVQFRFAWAAVPPPRRGSLPLPLPATPQVDLVSAFGACILPPPLLQTSEWPRHARSFPSFLRPTHHCIWRPCVSDTFSKASSFLH